MRTVQEERPRPGLSPAPSRDGPDGAGVGSALERARAALYALLDAHTSFSETGFSVDIAASTDRWDACIRALGAAVTYDEMARYLCERSRELYGREFLFSDRCVANEIAYHMNAYLCVRRYPGYRRHLTTYIFAKGYLIEHCKEIDISTDDVKSWRQRTMFGYRRGIREIYKGTADDPF
ncbi:MAG: hypothetical protein IK095_07390 [Oscillospiraceae bacterium]|nr:hypothetical protein [Oscillospiraceae bacterium]